MEYSPIQLSYFSLDMLDALNLSNLDAMVTSLLELVTNMANSDSVTQLVYDSGKGSTFDQADMMNAIALIDVLLAESQMVIPSPTNQIFMQFLTEYCEQAEAVAAASDFTDPASHPIRGSRYSWLGPVSYGGYGLFQSIVSKGISVYGPDV